MFESSDRRKHTKNGQTDVDAEVSTAATLEENSNGRKDDGKDDLADIAVWQKKK